MQDDTFAAIARLTDAELLARVKGLAARERAATAELVAHLAELDKRDVLLRAGYPSLFVYCRDGLGLSEAETCNRIEVARAARRFPVILSMLASGSVHLTSVRLLAPHLTAENHLTVLQEARGKRKVEVEELVARLAPRPDAPASVRKLPSPKSGLLAAPVSTSPATPGVSAPLPVAGHAAAAETPASQAAAPAAVPSCERPAPVRPPVATVVPLAEDRYRLQMTIDRTVLEKLRLAKDMLRHAIPSGDDAAILDRALTALLADLSRNKFAASRTPRPSAGTRPDSRHIPAAVRRTVWLRDLGRCAFVGEGGRRCGERAFLEFHHVRPYSVGGGATVENIQIRCRRHNACEAKVYFAREEHTPGLGGPGAREERDGWPGESFRNSSRPAQASGP
jgi:hypothetical protein